MEKIDFFHLQQSAWVHDFFFTCTFYTGSFVFVFVLAEIQFLFARKKKKEI
jgi:hypothetical protein